MYVIRESINCFGSKLLLVMWFAVQAKTRGEKSEKRLELFARTYDAN